MCPYPWEHKLLSSVSEFPTIKTKNRTFRSHTLTKKRAKTRVGAHIHTHHTTLTSHTTHHAISPHRPFRVERWGWGVEGTLLQSNTKSIETSLEGFVWSVQSLRPRPFLTEIAVLFFRSPAFPSSPCFTYVCAIRHVHSIAHGHKAQNERNSGR